MAALRSFTVPNFTESDHLQLEAMDYRNNAGIGRVLVHVLCEAGSLRLQHSLTPAQARQFADNLIACAEALESMEQRAEVPA